jgi:putative ubiquitin-RnfH superfamily antitoxin RatB of RatAB toxin-antitoxin module
MSKNEMIKVEVAYALPHKQAILAIELPVGATALEAAQQSGITGKFEGVDLDNATLGIFGQVVAPGQVLRDGDRVEVYRPLVADPKEVRKARAERARERRQKDKPA